MVCSNPMSRLRSRGRGTGGRVYNRELEMVVAKVCDSKENA